MGSKPKQPEAPPTPPPVATISAAAGKRTVESVKTNKKRYNYEDTLLSEGRRGFTGKNLDPRG